MARKKVLLMGVHLTKKEKSPGRPSDIKAKARLLSTKLCSLKKRLNSRKKIKSSEVSWGQTFGVWSNLLCCC